MIREISKKPLGGFAMVAVLLVLHLLMVYWLVLGIRSQSALQIVLASIATSLLVLGWNGFKIVHPNEAKVLQLFGRYVGTIRVQGLSWVNPLLAGLRVSLRVRNFESAKLKDNDSLGNPVDIAAVVVWKVVDTAEAVFEVDDYKDFVHIQSEAALRNLATGYPYDQHEEGEVALRSHTLEIADKLKREIQERLLKAGVEVIEARISHLAYAQEIAHAMLQRQQATAIIAARQKIVEGAVGMVEMAIQMLSERGVLDLDEERRVAMVSNLLVVLCGDENAQPILNTGTLYQ